MDGRVGGPAGSWRPPDRLGTASTQSGHAVPSECPPFPGSVTPPRPPRPVPGVLPSPQSSADLHHVTRAWEAGPAVEGRAPLGTQRAAGPSCTGSRARGLRKPRVSQPRLPGSAAEGPTPACSREPLTRSCGLQRSRRGHEAVSPGWLPAQPGMRQWLQPHFSWPRGDTALGLPGHRGASVAHKPCI